MKYHRIGVSLLAAAFVLEITGFAGGGVALLGAGIACEVWFWMGLVLARRAPHASRA